VEATVFSGNNMLLIGVLVVVLLALLVLLLVLNRRSAAKGRQGVVDAEPGWTEPAAASTDAGWLAVAADDLAWTEPSAPVPESAPAETPAPANPVAAAPAPHPSSTGTSDPVRTAVLALLEGVGELTQPETRRLELYRPERVLSLVNELEPAYASKGQEQGRSRLARIRKYAQEFQEDLASSGTAGAGAATGAGLALAADAGGSDGPHADTPAAEEWPPDVEGADDDITAETAAAAQEAATTDPHALYAVPAYADEAPLAALAGNEAPADVYEAPVAAEPAWLDEPVVMAEVDEAPPASATEHSAESDALDSLQLDISTAEDLLALPRSERVDALAFLEPEELGRTFTLADDADLKRAAIDVLEQHGTQEALASIQQCFDDNDPELQMYAVDAADRLLAQMGGGGS
jgi:hypothetical protein